MLFTDIETASQIEQADCGLLRDGIRVATDRRSVPDAMSEPIGGGLAGFIESGSPFNKIAGLGFDGALDADALASIEQMFFARKSDVQVELSTLADPAIGELLCQRGYVLKGIENVLGRDLASLASSAPPSGITIETATPDTFDVWLQTLVSGFAAPDLEGVQSHESFPTDVLERAIGDVVAIPSVTRFLARRDNDVAGGGAMRIQGNVAQLCGASTLTPHRRNGVQSALLQNRLEFAAAGGCDIAIVTTQPGSKSQQNVQRQGFELLYSRTIFVLEYGT